MNFAWLFSFLADSVAVLLFFKKDPNAPKKTRWWLKPILLLMLLPLYMISFSTFLTIPSAFIRVTYRIAVYFIFLRFAEFFSIPKSIYSAIFWTTVYVIFQNVYFGPYFRDIFIDGALILTSPFWNQVLVCFIIVAVRLIYFGIIGSFFTLWDIAEIKPVHICFSASVCLIAIYIQNTGMELQGAFKELPEQFSIYYILLHAVLLLFLLVYENFRCRSFEYAAMVQQNTVSGALLENIRRLHHNEESIRSLRHDLKNHIITLQLLLDQGNTEEAIAYLDSFQKEASASIDTFHLGSDLLNGIFYQKLSSAMEHGIDLDVNLDFRQGDFIDPFDLCVIFGNVLDNAVEACLKIDSGERRFIKVSGGPSANYLLIRVENSCAPDFDASDGFLHTTKENPLLHGYGIRNIRRVLDRYNGNLTIGAEASNRFTATMLIPIP